MIAPMGIKSPVEQRKSTTVSRSLPASRIPNEPSPKFAVQRLDGMPPDPNARYLVLRLDTDPFARKAAEIYAQSVSKNDPALAAAVRKACAATVKAGWSLPAAPRCECKSRCRPIALERDGRWSLEWECLACCEPVAEPPIAWPFTESFAKGTDFERIGIGWDSD